jgi:hypothetical protein
LNEFAPPRQLKRSMLSLITHRSIFVLICGCLLLSCSVVNRNQTSAQRNVATPTPSPTPEAATTTDAGTFLVRHFSDDPLAVSSATLSNQNKREIILVIKNISNATVKRFDYGVSWDDRCTDYMYSFVQSPRITYGNAPNQMPLDPNKAATVVAPVNKTLETYFNPKTYSSCPGNAQKPILTVGNVEYADGTIWCPNANIVGCSR